MILRQAFDVLRIVEQAFTLHLPMTGIVLPETLQAWPADCCGVGPPVSGSQLAKPIGSPTNATVDHRNQVAVRNQVENIPATWPVHTRKEKVTIQRGAITFFLVNRGVYWTDREVRGCRAPAQILRQHFHLKLADVTLKYEEVYRTEYRNLEEARPSIAEFLEKIYNQERLHSALGYRPPLEFERSLRPLRALGKGRA